MTKFDVMHVNPSLFDIHQMLEQPFIQPFCVFVVPIGEGRNTPVTVEDITRIIIETLVNPNW